MCRSLLNAPGALSGLKLHELKVQQLRTTAQLELAVAVAAIHRPVLSRLKRHFTVLAALSAYCRMHLAASFVPAEAVALRSPCFATGRAALGFIGIAPGGVKLLIIGAMGECVAAVGALQCSIGETHWMTSFLSVLG